MLNRQTLDVMKGLEMYSNRDRTRVLSANVAPCRFAKNNSISLLLVCLVVVAIIVPSKIFSAHAGMEARKVLKDIVSIVDHPSESPISGTGDAIVVENRDGKKKESRIEFRFKDDLSRSDVFEHAGGQKGALQVVYAENQKNSVSYNGYNAVIQASPPGAFHRTPHLDFHPGTFAKILGNPISTWLAGAAESDPDSILRLNLDPNEILHIEGGGGEGQVREWMSICLDTTKAYRLVAWEMRVENGEGPGSVERMTYTARWQRVGQTWYVQETNLGHIVTKIEVPGMGLKTSHFDAKMIVDNFVPNISIEDSEFTLQGLRVPYGTMINDDIVGITYRYGLGVRGTQRLEEPLGEAEFIKSIPNQPAGDANHANTNERESSTRSLLGKGEGQARSPALRIGLLAVATLCIGIALLLGIMRQRAKRQSGLS